MSLQSDERRLYDETWGIDGYADFSPGEHYLPIFLDMAQPHIEEHGSLRSVLDAGCGSGKGSIALSAHSDLVVGVDLSDAGLTDEFKDRQLPFVPACLWDDLQHTRAIATRNRSGGVFDWVYCTDVLEHIPEAFTMLVIHQLLRVSRFGLFLSISLVPDNFGVWVGRPLHLTVRDFAWWKQSLAELGTVTEARDLLNAAVFMVQPKEAM